MGLTDPAAFVLTPIHFNHWISIHQGGRGAKRRRVPSDNTISRLEKSMLKKLVKEWVKQIVSEIGVYEITKAVPMRFWSDSKR